MEFEQVGAGELWRREEERLLGSILLHWGDFKRLDALDLHVDDFEHGAKAWHGYVWQIMRTGISQRWSQEMLLDKLIVDKETHADFGEVRPARAVAQLITRGLPELEALVDSVKAAAISRGHIEALNRRISEIHSQMHAGLWRSSRERERALNEGVAWPDPSDVLGAEFDDEE